VRAPDLPGLPVMGIAVARIVRAAGKVSSAVPWLPFGTF
jgi:hypothetical protein